MSVPGTSFFPSWQIDFQVYYTAGSAVLDRLPIYSFTIGEDDLPFNYPPFAALLFAPFALLPIEVAESIWATINVLAIGVVSWFALNMMGIASAKLRLALAIGAGVLAHTLDSVQVNLVFGQINAILMLLVLLDFQPWMPPRWRGVATGIAASIKLTPLLIVIYFLCTGRTRDAWRAAAVFASTVLIGLLVQPSASREYWLEGTFMSLNRFLSPLGVNHSLYGLWARLSSDATTPPSWAPVVSAAVGILGLTVATLAHREGHTLLGVLIVSFTALVVSPVTWAMNYVWIVPGLIWLSCVAWRSASVFPTVVFILSVPWLIVPWYWLVQRPDGDQALQVTPVGIIGATLGSPMVPALLLLGTAPFWLRRICSPKPALLQGPQ